MSGATPVQNCVMVEKIVCWIKIAINSGGEKRVSMSAIIFALAEAAA